MYTSNNIFSITPWVSNRYVFNFLNTQNIVITMVLMSYSANCYIFVSFGFDEFFSSLWIIFFCFIVDLIFFDWLPDFVNFILLGAGYFCNSINILDCCSGTQLSYLEAVCSFGVLLLTFIRGDQNSI